MSLSPTLTADAETAVAQMPPGCPADIRALWQTLVEDAGRTGALTDAPQSFSRRVLLDLIPPELGDDESAETLLRCFHLVDGLARQPLFVRSFVDANASELSEITDVERFLCDRLAPVLMAPPETSFETCVSVDVIDLRLTHPSFVPADVRMVAPAVAAIENATGAACLALLLRSRGESRMIGYASGTSVFHGATAPAVEIVGSCTVDEAEASAQLHVAGHQVGLKEFGMPKSHACSSAGFVVAIPHASQRVWVAEFS